MTTRKNIFVIARRGHQDDEDQLTELLATLWQEDPGCLGRWLAAIGLEVDLEGLEVETQFALPSGKRPDIRVSTANSHILVESKLGSTLGSTQVEDYVAFLADDRRSDRLRALVLLTKLPEEPRAEDRQLAERAGVRLLARRWQEMGEVIAEPGEESLAGDFVQMLVREGLVKPAALTTEDWETWNRGYHVLLRLETFLTEFEPYARRMLPGAASGQPGLTKRWIYRTWRADGIDVGLGFGAAASDSDPATNPILFTFFRCAEAGVDRALAAVGLEKGDRYKWIPSQVLGGNVGLLWGETPACARPASEVLRASSFEEQLAEARRFVADVGRHFQGRGYIPSSVQIGDG